MNQARGSCGCTAYFYRRQALHGPHEHDQPRIPRRHGGTHTVAACRRCHDPKARGKVCHWVNGTDGEILECFGSDSNHETRQLADPTHLGLTVMRLIAGGIDATGFDLTTSHAVGRRTIEPCTTRAARIYPANVICVALDEHRRRHRRHRTNEPDADTDPGGSIAAAYNDRTRLPGRVPITPVAGVG